MNTDPNFPRRNKMVQDGSLRVRKIVNGEVFFESSNVWLHTTLPQQMPRLITERHNEWR